MLASNEMTAWRNAQARGQDLSVLAGIRQAERAKRRQRERVAFGDKTAKLCSPSAANSS